MAQEENPSNFNGLNLEIRGKILIEHSYSATNNQHHIAIGIPQLDHAETQVKCSQYDSDGNSVKEIDLTAYKSIEIVEFSQQPTTTQQSDDSINMEHALSRNQQRLSDFYQSYKHEDSSIDWSKIATKITLPSTSGKFYNHDNKRTVGFKIELSPEAVQRIDIRDGESTIASFSHSDQVSTRLHIDSLCRLADKEVEHPFDDTTGSFCTPTTQTLSYSGATNTFYVCRNCSVLYSDSDTSYCFAGTASDLQHTSNKSSTTDEPSTFIVPYNTNKSPTTDRGCGQICTKCGMLVYQNLACPNPSSENNIHSCDWDGIQTAYWIETRAQNNSTSTQIKRNMIPSLLAFFYSCYTCGGLCLANSIGGNVCRGGGIHTPNYSAIYLLLVNNNIGLYITSGDNSYYLNGNTNANSVTLQSDISSGSWWQLIQPNNKSEQYALMLMCSGPANYLISGGTGVSLGSKQQLWQVVLSSDGYNTLGLLPPNSTVSQYLMGTPPSDSSVGSVSLTSSPSNWKIIILN